MCPFHPKPHQPIHRVYLLISLSPLETTLIQGSAPPWQDTSLLISGVHLYFSCGVVLLPLGVLYETFELQVQDIRLVISI